ncbi:uncharacterized protein [Physcomitrium patens]|uniref:uncharacterized protein isoform X2 n=1 Tax=Physcomitrium patens TaxID=3218 RepID=UPI000D167821|nr:uncharacterized protein LOC112274544 isoform X2 [Physcomitrium patens]|eukprot:XP_024359962.1 uncharacterized protein LOC112274544 isoform X2 [Physcomitrella patens]
MTAAEELGCQACGLAITPCLVCASSLPVFSVDDVLMKACCRCGFVNPLGDKCREVLDIPPTAALPTAMVRRAQIARIGRRPYVLAKHAHFMHLSLVNKTRGEDEKDGGSGSHGSPLREISARFVPKDSPVPEIFASAEEGHPLTFLPYIQNADTRMHEEALCAARNASDARHFYPESDSESPVKRMRLSPRLTVIDKVEKNLSGFIHPILHQVQVDSGNADSVATASNGLTSNTCIPFKLDPAKLGESSGTLPADLELTGDKTSNSMNGVLLASHSVVEQEVGVDKELVTTRTEPFLLPIRSGLDSMREISKSPLIEIAPPSAEVLQHREGGKASVSTVPVANGLVEQNQKYNEHDCYPQMNIDESVKLPSSSVQKVGTDDEVDVLDPADHNLSRDLTGSEEAPTHRHERTCSECGQMGVGPGRSSSNIDEAELMRSCTQILELHCPHTLKADLRTSNAYPLCCPVPMFPLPLGSASSGKVCRSYVTQFTVDVLRAAHITLNSSTQESTSGEVICPLRDVEQTLLMAGRFIQMKGRVGNVRGLIQQIDAASAQTSRDLKAYADRGAFPLASQLIPRLLNREKQQHVDRIKNDFQVMTTLLQDINKTLSTCFQYAAKIVEESVDLVGDNHLVSNVVNHNVSMLALYNKPALEAVRTAFPLWIRLYHDVAHAAGLLK